MLNQHALKCWEDPEKMNGNSQDSGKILASIFSPSSGKGRTVIKATTWPMPCL